MNRKEDVLEKTIAYWTMREESIHTRRQMGRSSRKRHSIDVSLLTNEETWDFQFSDRRLKG